MRRLKVKAPDPHIRAATLSGGNQQKLLIARALTAKPRLLILDEPTHGVDVGTKREIHDLMRTLAGEGIAVWFISSEVEEIVELASRILVVHQGRITAELPGGSPIEHVLASSFGEVSDRRDR
jgi:ABC-type sugar transport system ATPase subunit